MSAKKKILINFGDTPALWIAAWHPCALPTQDTSEAQQQNFFKECVSALPPNMVRLLADAALERIMEIEANEEMGLPSDVNAVWERVYLPDAGNPMLN